MVFPFLTSPSTSFCVQKLEIQRNVDEAEFKASINEVKQVNAHLQTMLFSVSAWTATDGRLRPAHMYPTTYVKKK